MEVTERPAETSLGQLFGTLTEDLKHLVQQEARLAKVELTQKLILVATNLSMLILGTGVLYAGLLVALFTATTYLARAATMEVWQSGAIVALVTVILGAILASMGISSLKNMSLKPEQTVITLKEDAKWLKDQAGKS